VCLTLGLEGVPPPVLGWGPSRRTAAVGRRSERRGKRTALRAALRVAVRRRLGWMVLRAERTDGAPGGAEGGGRAALRAARRGRVGAVARGGGQRPDGAEAVPVAKGPTKPGEGIAPEVGWALSP
jgi:hypothetical protein